MRYGTGLKNGEDSGLCADITGTDVLATLAAATWNNHELIVTSCEADGLTIPEYLKPYGQVLGTLTLQNVDGTVVLDETTWLIEDGSPKDAADTLLLKILELNSCGTGEYCQILAIMEGPGEVRMSYWKHNSEDEPLGEL